MKAYADSHMPGSQADPWVGFEGLGDLVARVHRRGTTTISGCDSCGFYYSFLTTLKKHQSLVIQASVAELGGLG